MALKILLVFLGSGLGGCLRYALNGWILARVGSGFPVGTLTVNVLGCAAVGFLGAALTATGPWREELRLALLVGFLGGFTTFSAFGRETLALADGGQVLAAGANILLTNTLTLIAVWAGNRLALGMG